MINEGKIYATDIRVVGRRTAVERLAVGNGAASAGCLNVTTAGTPAPTAVLCCFARPVARSSEQDVETPFWPRNERPVGHEEEGMITIDTWETEGGTVAGRAVPQTRDRALPGSEALPLSASPSLSSPPVLSGQDEAP
jgi:hypothetical protein